MTESHDNFKDAVTTLLLSFECNKNLPTDEHAEVVLECAKSLFKRTNNVTLQSTLQKIINTQNSSDVLHLCSQIKIA